MITYDNNGRFLIILRIRSSIYFLSFEIELFKCGTIAICIWMLSIFDKKYLFVSIIFENIKLQCFLPKHFRKLSQTLPKHLEPKFDK